MQTIDVIALSCAIFRTTGQFLPVSAKHLSNATQLRFELNVEEMPEHYERVAVGDEDMTTANNIIKFYHRLTFKVLNNTITDFEKLILKVIDSEFCTSNNINTIACLPPLYESAKNKIETDKLINETDGYIDGTLGSKIITWCYLIKIQKVNKYKNLSSSHPMQNIPLFSHTAITSGGQLVTFLSKNILGNPHDSIRITGKIKEFKTYFSSTIINKPVTQLNYVSLI